ncbi:hypothetical protein J6590_077429 [Homalodisca vitripennis]|nr:hypothetical protein J6590_077429 [Homalodisca vitripennis]
MALVSILQNYYYTFLYKYTLLWSEELTSEDLIESQDRRHPRTATSEPRGVHSFRSRRRYWAISRNLLPGTLPRTWSGSHLLGLLQTSDYRLLDCARFGRTQRDFRGEDKSCPGANTLMSDCDNPRGPTGTQNSHGSSREKRMETDGDSSKTSLLPAAQLVGARAGAHSPFPHQRQSPYPTLPLQPLNKILSSFALHLTSQFSALSQPNK